MSRTRFGLIKHGTSVDGENFHGISCINSEINDLSGSSKVPEKAINNSVKASKIDVLFNRDFNRTGFAQFFGGGYVGSNFFKSLNEGYSHSFLMFSTAVQMIVSTLLLVLIGFMYFYFKKLKISYRSDSSSIMELC